MTSTTARTELRDGLVVRPDEEADEPAVLGLMEDSLGWRPEEVGAVEDWAGGAV